jgi:hypothetical protein
VGVAGPKASMAVASVAPDHGTEVIALGTSGTRQANREPRTRTRQAGAAPPLTCDWATEEQTPAVTPVRCKPWLGVGYAADSFLTLS